MIISHYYYLLIFLTKIDLVTPIKSMAVNEPPVSLVFEKQVFLPNGRRVYPFLARLLYVANLSTNDFFRTKAKTFFGFEQHCFFYLNLE